MSDERESAFPDARLLKETLNRVNISRRNASIYPRGHPAVERSLRAAFDLLGKLMELKPEIVLAVAKDSLIFDEFVMEKKNPVYREFALTLSRMNIVSVTFVRGLTEDELYQFHVLLSGNVKDPEAYASLQESLQKLSHIQIGLVGYRAFSFSEGTEEEPGPEGHLWERYVYGLLEGTLQTEEASDDEVSKAMEEVPAEQLSGFLNDQISGGIAEGACDRLVGAFMRKTPKKTFSVRGIKKLIELLNGLNPELKKEFLSRAVKLLAGEIAVTEKTLTELTADKALEIIRAMKKYDGAIPEQLEKLFDTLEKLHQQGIDDRFFSGRLIMDDIVLSPEFTGPVMGDKPEAAAGDEVYQKQIQQILLGDAPAEAKEELKELRRECSDEHIEKEFNATVLEFLLPESSEEDYGYLVSLLKEQAEQFLWTGQYGEVIRIVRVLESNIAKNRFTEKTAESLRYYRSGEFISKLVDSFRTVGRQMREEALQLCEYYDEGILPELFRALVEEESASVRRFLLGLITHFGDRAVPEAVKRLADNRWFVTRNMIFIISECGDEKAVSHIRPYCSHENPRVSFEAIKCLLRAGDGHALPAIRDHLKSEDREKREQTIALSGSFRVREIVPDLVTLLKKREVSSADFYAKIPLVRALGQIGDPDALEALRDILVARSFLFRGAVEKLKEEIYSSLRNYPHEKLTELVELGMKSKNDSIRKAALRLRAGR